MSLIKKFIGLFNKKQKQTPLTPEQLKELDEWVVIANQTIFK
jgi:hypothetical protein